MTLARTWLWLTAGLTAAALISAIVLAPPAGAPPVRALTWLLFTGSSVHIASTGYLFTVPAVREYARAHPVRCRLGPAALGGGTAIAASLIRPAAFQWLLLPYFGWQFYHYQKQNLGLAALAAAAGRVRPLTSAERWPLLAAGWSAVGAVVARPGRLGLRVTMPVSYPLSWVALAAYVIATAAGLAALARRPASERGPGFSVIYLLSLAFSLPVFAFTSPYAAIGGLTVAHGLQYLLLVGLVASGPARPGRTLRLLALANVALIGSAALSAVSHLHNAAAPGRMLFGAYLGVVMTHFVIDAGLWRMRDPLARAFLTAHLNFLRPPASELDGTRARPRPGASRA
ncbi:MAG: hypothetical protein ACR2FU_16910 [Streptosporangiaceae bacterium]